MISRIAYLIFCCFLCIHHTYGQESSMGSPFTVFNELWTEFDQRYSNFDVHNTDWKALYNKYHAQINMETSEDELFSISCRMLQELKDSHINLVNKTPDGLLICNGNHFPDSTTIIKKFSTKENFHLSVDSTLYSNGFNKLKSAGKIIHYSKSEQYGYLRISKMERGSRALKEALEHLKESKGLIIDIRLNPGGNDAALYQFAGRFADQKRIGHYKKNRIKGTNKFSELKAKYLKPTGKFQYTKPIVILTSDYTASAAEIFVLAMKQLPYVTTVGENTNGAFSHAWKQKLSNRWIVTLSHQKGYSVQMKNYEGCGIEPDVVSDQSNTDISDYKDEELMVALRILDNNQRIDTEDQKYEQ